MSIEIRRAGSEDGPMVGELAYLLVRELAPESADEISLDAYRATAAKLLGQDGGFWALLAYYDQTERPCGLVTLNECAAIYAGGRFGEIPELFVAPDYRSRGVAAALVKAAVDFARGQGWHRLEVGAPDQPRWQRTMRFYFREGFTEVGPRLSYIL